MNKYNKIILKRLIESEVSNYISLLLEQETPPAPPAPEEPAADAPAPTPEAPAPPTPDATGAAPAPTDTAAPPPDAAAGAPPDAGGAAPAPDAAMSPDAAAGAPAGAEGGDMGAAPPGADAGTGEPAEETFGIKQIEAPPDASPEQGEKIQFNNSLLDLAKTKREEYKNLTNPDQLIWNELKTELINSNKDLSEAIPATLALSVSTDQIMSAVGRNLAVFILLK